MSTNAITLPPAPWGAIGPDPTNRRETAPTGRVTLRRQITEQGERSRITQAIAAIKAAHADYTEALL